MKAPSLGSIEAKAVPESVDGKRRFRGTFCVILDGYAPIEGRTVRTYADELTAVSVAQQDGARMAALRTRSHIMESFRDDDPQVT